MARRSDPEVTGAGRATRRGRARRFARVPGPLRGLLRGAAGNVTIEFGFVILFMASLALGAVDFGRLGLRKIAVTNAARAGAQYGTQDMVTAQDVAGMIQAARNDIGDDEDELDITARNYYFCPGQGEVAKSAMCDDGSFSLMYVDVTVEDEVDLFFFYPGVSSPRTITSASPMRVR
ncbi:MAG: hypothetical protein GWM93_17065 [Gemmatimonadetes bacterium]|nr:hypothetical protein [Gemmatimonadota bacterium]NIT68367.1 hypothetical protein [Gemmatimonadota bacterium]NIY36944.1 hypothetical protein [Gemmatimonadota bacterium]